MTNERPPAQWFLHAERAYSEHHQGCAWCGGAHCVGLSRRGVKRVYCCQRCDFQVSYDAQADQFQIVPGEELTEVPDTMLAPALDSPR